MLADLDLRETAGQLCTCQTNDAPKFVAYSAQLLCLLNLDAAAFSCHKSLAFSVRGVQKFNRQDCDNPGSNNGGC